MCKPSSLLQIRQEIFEAIAFEHWDQWTKNKVEQIVRFHNLNYEAPPYLDEKGKLYITIWNQYSKYKIMI